MSTRFGILFLAAALGQGGAANLLLPSPGHWQQWSPRPALAPEMKVVQAEAGTCLRTQARRFASYGKWIATAGGVRPGAYYRFEVLYRPEQIGSEETSIAVILSWRAGGRTVQRDYVDSVAPAAAGWRRAARTLHAPAAADSVTVELGLRWTEHGAVLWRDATLAETDTPAKRRIKVVTTRIQPAAGATVEKNIELMAATFDRAAVEHPDLILFTENLVDRHVSGPLPETSQTVPGPATRMLSGKARRYRTWVATSLHELDGDLIYNTAVLIDREGRIAGKYRKVHLATSEGENGVTPGSDYPVFDTDFGRVGMLVCWDNWFGEAARALRLKGAEMLLLPIAADGVPHHWDVISRARAVDNGMWVVASSTYANSPSRIIDPDGDVVAETAGGIAVAEIDLNKESRVRWLSVGDADGEAKSLYIKERRPETYGALTMGTIK